MATTTKKTTKKRATKAKTIKVVAVPSQNEPKGRKPRPGQELHPMRLKGTLFHKMRAYAAECEAGRTRVQLLMQQVQIEASKKEHQVLVALMQARDEAQQKLVHLNDAFLQVQLEVAKKLGLTVEVARQYSFDTESGVLLPPGPPPKNQ